MEFECVFDLTYITLCHSQQGKILGFCIDLILHVKKLSSEQGMCLFVDIVCQGSTNF